MFVDTISVIYVKKSLIILLFAKSFPYVQALVQRLYNELKDVTNSTADGIKAAITNETYASANADGVLTFTNTVGGDLSTKANCYPASLNLPDGAAIIGWNAEAENYIVSK